MIEHEPLGEDSVADLILLNYKCADFVGHKYGPESEELRVTLAEIDRQVARVLSALEAKVGKDYLLAVTADHGMPSLPPSPDHRHFATTIADLLHEKFDPEGSSWSRRSNRRTARSTSTRIGCRSWASPCADLAQFLESQPYMFAVFTNDAEVARVACAWEKPATSSGANRIDDPAGAVRLRPAWRRPV